MPTSTKTITRILQPFVLLIGVCLFILFFSMSSRSAAASQEEPITATENNISALDTNAAQIIQNAWQRAQESGAYAFDADITQIQRPLPSVLNVGKPTKRDNLYLEGITNLDDQTLEMTLWTQGGTVQDKDSGAQIRIEEDVAFARQAGQSWQEIDNFTGLFAPGNDFMAYLVAAVNVQDQGNETRAGIEFKRITFEIDGLAYAQYMRDQVQADMLRRGELQAGARVDLPKMFSGMTGTGELWIGTDGLPLRQILQLDFAPEGDHQVSAEVSVSFKDFSPLSSSATAVASPANTALNHLTPILPTAANPSEIIATTNQMAIDSVPFIIGCLLIGLILWMLVRARRSRKVLGALQLSIILAMVIAPLLRSVNAEHIAYRQQDRLAASDARSQESSMMTALKAWQGEGTAVAAGTVTDILNDSGTDSDNDGYTDVEETFLGTNPLTNATLNSRLPSIAPTQETPTKPLPADDGTDSDGDGLTDYVEALIGTAYDSTGAADTDGDGINDAQEVFGFTDAFGEDWVTDPLEADTNRDGINDGLEWTINAVGGIPADSDNDHIPDLFDNDNDGDGVPDKYDLSPNTFVTKTFDGDNPFSLILNGLETDKITYVEFQLRPTNAEHLQYTYNAFDWPDDTQGNIQDGNSSREDIRLIPMLEMIMPDAASNLLPLDTLGNYSIMVQDLPGENQAIYVPLNLQVENRGSRAVAFNGKMIYSGAAAWDVAHQVRLVWIVQAQNDVCAAFDDAGLCASYSALDTPQVIHTYEDTWQLTGLNVRENHWSDVATVYEDWDVDEDPKDDSAIWMLGHGLDLTFMAGGVVTGTNGTRLWDVAEIENRFDHTTNGGVDIEQRWEISNTLSVQTASYSHLDEAMVTTVQTTTLNLLNSEFTSHWSAGNPISPTLIFARQDQYRSFNLDETAVATVSWGVTAENTNELTLNIPQTAVPLEIASTLSWAPYLYDDLESQWKSYPIEQYWEYLAENIAAEMATEYTDPEVAAGATILAQIYYMALNNGLHNIVQVGDQRLQQSYFNEDRPLAFSFANGGRVATIFLVKFLIERQNLESTVMLRLLFAQIRDAKKFAAANPFGATQNTLGSGLTAILSKLKAFGLSGGMAKFAVFLVVAAIAVGIGFLIATAFGESTGGPARIAVAVVAGAVTFYLGVIGPVMQIRALAGAYQTAAFGGLSASNAYLKAAFAAESVSKGAKIAAGVGLVIAVVISWVMFAYIIGNSDIAPGSVEFNTLLAQTIAATILAVIQFALSLTIVGAILIAILGIIDLLLFIIGVDFSINGWLTEQLGKFIYHFELTIDSDIDTGEPDLTLINPNGGMVEGMMMAATMPITTSIVHNDPDDFWGWRILPYLPAYYTTSNLRSTTFKYSLTTEEAPFNSGRDNIRSQWYAVAVDHHYAGWKMYGATNYVEPTTNLTLQAGINGPLSIYLNNSYALPGVECWTIYQPFIPPYYFPLCLDKTIEGKGSSDVGSYLILDVLPDTLDEFVALDWGVNLDFPVQADYDNDKLTTRALNGNDPDDTKWDTDFDGLSDSYEILRRESGTLFDPNSIDSDLDGLSDYDEIRFGTDPGFQDTDRDGLKDSEEVWHFDTISNSWSGGWMFNVTYTDTNNIPNQTLSIRIFSDPLQGDVDEDGMSDGVEKALHDLNPVSYPFHPNAFNESPIALYVTVDDEDRFVAPNQSVVISSTVRNNLSDPLFAKGGQTLTIPPGLGDFVLTQDFNIFQGQTSSIVTTTNVTASSSGPLNITAESFTRLHDGDLSWSYAWLPNQTNTATPTLGDRVSYVSIAANPGPASIPYKYAVGALEYPNNLKYSSVNALGNGVATARTASTMLGGATTISFNNNPDIYHTVGKIGNYQTDVACNAQGKCAEAYIGARWSECTNVYFDYMHVYKEDDAGDKGEYGLYHNFASGASRVRFWGWVDGDNGDDLTINKTRLMCPGDTISAYEEDPSPNGDDNLGKHEPDITGPHGPASHRYKNGDDVEVYYYVQAAAEHWGFLRLLNSNLTHDLGVTKNFSFLPDSAGAPRTQMLNPAVTTSGSRWLAGYEKYKGYAGELYVMSVNNNGTDNSNSRLDTDSTLWGYKDHALDLAWNGNHFLAVWETDVNSSNHNIKMARVDLNGNVVERKDVDVASSLEREPAVAYSASLNQVLLVYVSGTKVVGRFIEGSTIGARFDIGSIVGNQAVVAEPKVAYDETNNIWIVSWLSAAQTGPTTVSLKSHVIPLAPTSLNGGVTALTPPQAYQITQGDTYDMDCANPDVAVDPNFRQTTNCAIVSSSRSAGGSSMKLNTVLLESTPPWIGGGGGLTNTAAELLTVDADDPISSITSFANGETVPITDTFPFGGEATDPTATAENGIVLVEVNIDGSGWQPASGTNSWSFVWDVPSTDGTHSIQVRATDLVGHVETPQPAISVTLDRSGPQPTINTPPEFVAVTQNGNGRYQISFSGTVNDTDSGIASVEAAISPSGNGWQTTSLDGNVWFVDYILPEFDENGDRVNNPTGNFTLSVRATDNIGNVTNSSAYATMPFKLDTTPPTAALIDYGPSRGVISDTITLTGVITEPGSIASGIQQLEIDFVPAGQISETWQPASLASSGPGVALTTWSHTVPSGLEGNYLINLRGTDEQGNQGSEDSWFSDWQGEIDTLAPRVTMTATLIHNGEAAKTLLEATITDRGLTEAGLEFPCDVWRVDRGYESVSFSNTLELAQDRLTSLHLSCQVKGHITDPINLRVFDIYGHETVATITASGAALPLLTGTVLTPTHKSAITNIATPITIEGAAYGISGLKTITLTINGSFHDALSIAAAPVVTDTTWQMSWTPPGEGVYELVTTVEDWASGVQADPYPVTVFVDTTAPDLTLNATTLTAVHRLSAGRVELMGTVTDTLGLEAVTVAIDGGPALAADLDEPNWRYVWPLPTDPDGTTYNVVVTALDVGNETTINTTITVDLVAPQGMVVTPGYTTGGAPVPINAGDTVRDPATTGLTSAWTAATDGSGVAEYRVGWTNSPTPTLAALTAYPDATALHTTPVSEATLWFGHAAAIDTVGNGTIESIGPIVVDAPNTPDYINPSDGLGGVYRGWMESGCSLVGADYEAARYAPDGAALNSVQQFYTSWDATHLRLAWTGADWRVDGDLFIYLDTTSGGATAVYNPYSGAGAAITLPDEGSDQMGADYLIFVEDGDNATLLSWNGSAWVQTQALTAPNFLFDPNNGIEKTDLYIPFTLLGSPSSLKMVALASDEEALRLWAAMPDHNPLNSEKAVNPAAYTTLDLPFALTQHYSWTNVGAAGVCPATGQFENTDLHFELVAEPAGVSVGFLQHDLAGLIVPASALDADLDGNPDAALPLDLDPVPVGQGLVISYTLNYENRGTAVATGVVADVTAAGGLTSLSSNSLALGTIAPGSSGSASFTAVVDTGLDGESAEVRVQVGDAVHAPFEWLWQQHDIDSVGPTDVKIVLPVTYIGANTTTLYGVATDVSGVPEFTLRVNGSTTQTCLDDTPDDGEWHCLFDAGGAADGTTFQFDAKGTDEWNNMGNYGPAVTLVVDSSAPSIALNAASLAALNDGYLTPNETPLGGTVTDDRVAGGAEVCVLAASETEPTCVQVPVSPSGQATANWLSNVPIPDDADGESYTLTFYGIDSAGNRTLTPLTYVVTADFTGPNIQVTTQPTLVAQYSTVVALAGTISDGSGVASLRLQVTAPDNGDLVADEYVEYGLGNGANWSRTLTFNREGNYQLGLIGVDTRGNRTSLGTFIIQVLNAGVNVPPTADTGGPYVVNEGETLTLNGMVDDFNLASGQILTYAWDMDDDSTFETAATLTPVFDATTINGPAQRTVWLQVNDGEFTTTVSTIISIINVPPTADAGGPYFVAEGDLLTVTGSGADPFAGDTVTFAWDMDNDGVFTDTLGATAVYDATDLDGPDSDIISLQVTDSDGASSVSTVDITVTNVDPQLANLFANDIGENEFATLTGDIIDPAVQDSFDLEILWGDQRSTLVTIGGTTAVDAGIALVPGSAVGNQVARLEADATFEAALQHRFENGSLNGWVSQDWSSYDGLSFWLYGTGSGTTLFVELYDNRNPGSIIDDAEHWRYEFADNTAGWQQVTVLFADLERAESEVGAPNDGLGLTEVWGWAVGSATTNGLETRFIDDVSLNSTITTNKGNDFPRESQELLYDTTVQFSTITVLDDFENGLPSGNDSNGITVGFSTRRDSWAGTSYYNYPAATTTFTETHLYIDEGVYPVSLKIIDDDDGFNSYSTVITVTNAPPVVNFSPITQAIQYSDGIMPIVITATDVISDPLTLNMTWSVDGGGATPGVPAALTLADDGCSSNGNYTQSCIWTVTGIVEVPAGAYVLTATLDDGDGGVTAVDIPITILPEATSLTFDPDNPVSVPVTAPGSNASEPFTLNVGVTELLPDSAVHLAAAGDINLAELAITLDPVATGSPITVTCTPQPVAPVNGYGDILNASCDFTAVPVNAYYVLLNVNGGYYGGTTDYVLTVYDPTGGISGGAHAAALESCLVTDDQEVKVFADGSIDCNFLAGGSGVVEARAFVDGDVVSFKNIQLKQDATVTGDAIAAGTVSLLNGAVVQGTISEGATVYQPVLPILNITAGSNPITVPANTTRNLLPGSFGNLVVGNGAVLNLGSGTYRFANMTVADNATINLDLSTGPIVISVAGDVTMGQAVMMTSNGAMSDVLIEIAGGSVALGANSTYVGTFVAPEGFIEVQAGVTVAGVLYGNKIHIKQAASFTGSAAVRLYFNRYIVPAFGGTINQAPFADFGYNAVGLDVTFNDTSSDLDGTITSWSWDFGDGNSATTQNPTHSYSAAGSYDVTLTVTDNNGATSSVIQQVVVGVTPAVAPTVTIAVAANQTDATLSWGSNVANCGYEVHSDLLPYFTPGAGTLLTTLPGTTLTFTVPNVLLNPDGTYFIVRAQSCGGGSSADSLHVGVFNFPIVPGS